jgi:hypothetical protein
MSLDTPWIEPLRSAIECGNDPGIIAARTRFRKSCRDISNVSAGSVQPPIWAA